MKAFYHDCCGCCPDCCGCGFLPAPPREERGKGAAVIEGEFREYTAGLSAASGEAATDVFLTYAADSVTVFAKNTGEAPVSVSLQNSPDGLDFVDDPQQLELAAGQTGYLVPYIFSKYIRARVQSDGAGSADIWVQMQNRRYTERPR